MPGRGRQNDGLESGRYWLPKAQPAWGDAAKTAAVLAVLAALWWILAAVGGKPLILPTPPQVFARLGALVATGGFWLSVGATLLRIVCGFCLGMALGTLCGFLMYRVRVAQTALTPLIRILQAAPIVSFILIALIWIPSAFLPVFISAAMVLPVAWSNVSSGLRHIDPAILEMASVFRIPRRTMLSKVFWPAIRSNFDAALVSGVGLAWKSGITAEVLALPLFAIGHEIYNAKIYLETPDLFAWTIVVILLSFALETGFKRLLRYQRRGRPAERGGLATTGSGDGDDD